MKALYSIAVLTPALFIMTLQTTLTPEQLTVIIAKPANFSMKSKSTLESDMELLFEKNPYVNILAPLTLNAVTGEGRLHLEGRRATKGHRLAVEKCASSDHAESMNSSECARMQAGLYVEVTVLKSSLVATLVIVVGWAYFTAWSVSFYPQILLNIQRKSVIGLNFDFLVLNIVGFLAYSAYNLFMYFDRNVQAEYEQAHPRSPIPVLLNDVFFATHALLACLVTAVQCFIYERGNQRVSYTCMAITATMGTGALATGIAMVLGYMNMLQFVTSLSYIKMAVTLFKYIPQALLNFRRKSTTGWSIGNVLLDFTGGCLDILQMCLQCWNVADWTAFYGNPVKFGLGLVSIFFDILFMIQHYVLYPHGNERDDVEEDGESKRNFSKEGKMSGKEPVNEKLMSVHSERLQEKNGEERRATSRSDEEESGSKHDDGN